MKVAALFLLLVLPVMPVHAVDTSASLAAQALRVCFPKQHADIMNFLVYVAKDRGFFEAQKLDVSIETLIFKFHDFSGPAKNFQMESWEQSRNGWGKVCHFSSLSAGGALGMLPERIGEVVPLLLSQYDAHNDMDLVVRASSTIKSVEGLKGKRIKVGNLPSLISLTEILKSHGMKVSDILIRPGNQSERLMGGLSEGKHDAGFTMPLLSDVFKTRSSTRTLESGVISRHLKTLPGVFLVAEVGFYDSQPQTVKKFMKALDEARAYVEKHPEALLKSAESMFDRSRKKMMKLTPEEHVRAGQTFAGERLLDMRKPAQAERMQEKMKDYYKRLAQARILNTPYNLDGWVRTPTK
ncbi:MAG: ABC transporter substrate-binding protein [Bdellovibrionales bacterium]|nr:ABC transporter substrate-binding protein [Bdellovibrionales bacterium]